MTEQAIVPAQSAKLSFGQSDVRPQDIVPPRVKIVQNMSKEVADGIAKPGDFYNTLTGENYGPTIRVQPLTTFMTRILLVRTEKRKDIEKALKPAGLTLDDGDGLLCRSFDMEHGIGSPGTLCETCPLSQWREGRQPPLCTETYNIAASSELGDLLLLSFAKSGAKVGKRLFSAIRLTAAAPWLRFIDLTTKQDRNELGNFFVPEFRLAEQAPPELVTQAARWAERLQGVTIRDVTPVDEDLEDGGPSVDIDADGQPF